MEKMSIYAKSRYRYDSKDPVYKNTHSVIKAANIRFIFLTQNCSECGENNLMSEKAISNRILSDTLTLSECKSGFWLYDKTRGMNLAMRAKTAEEAFTRALTYYQRRLSTVESEFTVLSKRVGDFMAPFVKER